MQGTKVAALETVAVTTGPRGAFTQHSHSWLEQVLAGSQQSARLMVILLTPAALLVFVLGLWRLGADLGVTEAFPISQGVFSHWQAWMILAIGLKFGASLLAAKTGLGGNKRKEKPVLF